MPQNQPSAAAKWSVKAMSTTTATRQRQLEKEAARANTLRCAHGCGAQAPTRGALCRRCWRVAQPPAEWVAEYLGRKSQAVEKGR